MPKWALVKCVCGLLGRGQVGVCAQEQWWGAEAVGGKAEGLSGGSRGACPQSRGQTTPRSGVSTGLPLEKAEVVVSSM